MSTDVVMSSSSASIRISSNKHRISPNHTLLHHLSIHFAHRSNTEHHSTAHVSTFSKKNKKHSHHKQGANKLGGVIYSTG